MHATRDVRWCPRFEHNYEYGYGYVYEYEYEGLTYIKLFMYIYT